ncbi:helix-turn-helix domain-containing protein [Nonomuraea soli]|uniref:Cytoskeletal protein RodZ n=1 Tax=Nonomuraea soli TaxID=1032476 RepID=A0A7W0CD11_9ACTN|nr:RodZ domain-containing protein [Nonomuraea soli]MBA2888921.1 cytoskeletal protein RodZ [Nonomuraea soli]
MNEQSIGSMLAEARREKGLTVGQLSASTRIREAVLYAIERDDFSLCGGDFYARGHVRSFARAVGLDPATMVQLYDDQHGGLPVPVKATAVFQADRRVKLRERRGPNWTMALGVALAIVVVFGVVRVMGGSGQTPTAEIMPASSIPSLLPSNVAPGDVAPVQPRQTQAQSTARNLKMVTVKVLARRSAYVNVRDAKGRKLFAGTLAKGKSSTWKAPSEVKLLIGDAGAVSLQVNGKNLGTLGSRGQTIRRSFGPSAARPR